jgi:hypothetical protein
MAEAIFGVFIELAGRTGALGTERNVQNRACWA